MTGTYSRVVRERLDERRRSDESDLINADDKRVIENRVTTNAR
jgi:hypothetical protein